MVCAVVVAIVLKALLASSSLLSDSTSLLSLGNWSQGLIVAMILCLVLEAVLCSVKDDSVILASGVVYTSSCSSGFS